MVVMTTGQAEETVRIISKSKEYSTYFWKLNIQIYAIIIKNANRKKNMTTNGLYGGNDSGMNGFSRKSDGKEIRRSSKFSQVGK